jgi:hypothetical protein
MLYSTSDKGKKYAKAGATMGAAMGMMSAIGSTGANELSDIGPIMGQTVMGGLAGGMMGGAIGTVMDSMDSIGKTPKKKKGNLMELF